MSKTVSQVIVEVLAEAGAQRCYGIVGDTINHLTDAIRGSTLEWVHVRHEEVGALAAGGEAYMTGELAVCAGSCGPGSLHFLNGIFESHRNGAPVLLIASSVDRREEGFGFPQEVDQAKLYEQCSVFCQRIAHPDQARRTTVMAAQAALTQGGVAVLIVNGDMFEEASQDDAPWRVHRPSPVIRPCDDELEALAGLLADSARVTLYAGFGARNAHDQVVALAERLQAPVVHTSRAKEFIEPDNPYNVGMTGVLGNQAGMQAVLDCDLLLCIGTDFAYRQFYPQHAKIVQIDKDGTNIGKRSPVSLGLVGDVKDTLDALLDRVKAGTDREHLSDALAQWSEDRSAYAERSEDKDPQLIHPQFVVRMLDELADDNAIFTADGGTPTVWLLRHVQAKGARRFLISLLHGTMANAYPQALGIRNAYAKRQVIALCGDGGLTMLLGDLLTLVQEEIPLKLLVLNNGALGFVEMEQRIEGLLDAYTDLKNPDLAEIARACGLTGYRVQEAEELQAAMDEWLADEGPALLDVQVSRMELIMPPKVEAGQVVSTALYGVKAVLNGRTDELITLLRDNFVR